MSTLSNQAARLNEEGAYHLERGDDSSAFAAFKDSLEGLSSDALAKTSASVSAMLSPRNPMNAANKSGSAAASAAKTTRPKPSRGEASIPCAEDEEAFLYDRCLSFEEDLATDPEATPYCSAMIIFNMALVFQKRGKDEKNLYKALFLYMVCLRHLQTSTTDRFKESDVVIAALNNQAVIFYMLKDHGKARAVLNELWSLLRELQCRPKSFVKADIDGFVQNILLLLHSPSLAAAA